MPSSGRLFQQVGANWCETEACGLLGACSKAGAWSVALVFGLSDVLGVRGSCVG